MLLLLVEYTVAFLTWFLVRMHPYWRKVEPFVKTLLYLLIQLIISFWGSAFIYIAFYYFYVPDAVYEAPVNFIFKSQCNLEPRPPPSCIPSASVPLQTPSGHKHFAYGQTYKVFLEIDVPESQVNQNLGVFVVALDFYSQKGAVTYSSRRTTMLQYKSLALSLIDTLIRWPFFVFGSNVQKQTLRLEMMSSFVDDPYKSTSRAVVELETSTLQFYSARLLAYAQFSGIKYWLFYHPFISAFVGFGILFLMWNFFMFVVFLRRVLNKLDEEPQMEEPPQEEWPDPKPTLKRGEEWASRRSRDHLVTDAAPASLLLLPQTLSESNGDTSEVRQRSIATEESGT